MIFLGARLAGKPCILAKQWQRVLQYFSLPVLRHIPAGGRQLASFFFQSLYREKNMRLLRPGCLLSDVHEKLPFHYSTAWVESGVF